MIKRVTKRSTAVSCSTARAALVALFVLSSSPLGAGEADVLKVEVTEIPGSGYTFQVTVRHADEGWEHYADRWDLLAPDGGVLATRILHHPHVDEQPFTRSLSGVELPSDVSEVTVRARDSVHGYGGEEIRVKPGR